MIGKEKKALPLRTFKRMSGLVFVLVNLDCQLDLVNPLARQKVKGPSGMAKGRGAVAPPLPLALELCFPWPPQTVLLP